MSGHEPTTDAPPPKPKHRKSIAARLRERLWAEPYFAEHLEQWQIGKAESVMLAAYNMGRRDALVSAAREAGKPEDDNA